MISMADSTAASAARSPSFSYRVVLPLTSAKSRARVREFDLIRGLSEARNPVANSRKDSARWASKRNSYALDSAHFHDSRAHLLRRLRARLAAHVLLQDTLLSVRVATGSACCCTASGSRRRSSSPQCTGGTCSPCRGCSARSLAGIGTGSGGGGARPGGGVSGGAPQRD